MNTWKHLLSAILSLALVLSIAIVPAQATSSTNIQIEQTTSEIVQSEIQRTTDSISLLENVSLEVSEIKEAHDFAGNLYYVTEFSPDGYMITQADTQQIIEYCLDAASPYYGIDSEIYYIGPTYYYYEDNGVYKHTFYDETISEDNALKLVDISNSVYSEISDLSTDSDVLEATSAEVSPASTTTYTDTYAPNSKTLLENLKTTKEIGYYCPPDSKGICGYIASGLMLLWADKNYNNNLINDFIFLNRTGKSFTGTNFTRLLRSYGTKDSSNAEGTLGAQSLKTVISDYCAATKCNITIGSQTIITKNKIISLLATSPVLLTGNIVDASSDSIKYFYHDVVAYGYRIYSMGEPVLIVHYGFSNYSNVALYYNTIETALWITGSSNQTISFSDVASSRWSYNAVSYCTRYQLFKNSSGTSFAPNAGTSRGQFINALYQLAGAPEYSSDHEALMLSTYTDFTTSTPYHDALVWAHENGIIAGTSSTSLSSAYTVTREQAALFLKQYYSNSGITYGFSSTSGPTLSSFNDGSSVDSWAREGMEWATKRYLFAGDENGNIRPTATITKEEAAQIVYAYTQRATKY